jgi:hypothetical protein
MKAIDYSCGRELNGMIELAYPGSVYFVLTRETADRISVDTNILVQIVEPMVSTFYHERSKLTIQVQ